MRTPAQPHEPAPEPSRAAASPAPRRPWRDELEIIDRVMKAVSGLTDPEEMVSVYWNGIGELVPGDDYIALSRRGVEPPEVIITRSSRFTEHFNPWTQREKLPRVRGGILREIAYANRPMIIEDLAARLAPDDPGRFYLEGYEALVALPQYDGGEGLNVSASLLKPGERFDRSMVPMMHWQAGLFGRATQSLVLRNQLGEVLRELHRELEVVAEIQRSLLPETIPAIPGFELAAHYQTSDRAGGDYYDFFPLGEHTWGTFIADVSGHGTPAAVLMAITHAIAHTRPSDRAMPGAVLAYLNHHLARTYTRSGTFVTAFYATLDPASRMLTYSTAGHNPPRLLRGGHVRSVDRPGGLPLGIFEAETYGDFTIQVERGDLLLLYTDGITEAMAPPDESGSRELFGVERLDEVLRGCSDAHPQWCVERICDAVEAFTCGAAATDDRTLVAIRCLG